jgi:hypothetical protein
MATAISATVAAWDCRAFFKFVDPSLPQFGVWNYDAPPNTPPFTPVGWDPVCHHPEEY